MQSERAGTGIGMTSAACLWLGLFPLLQFGSFHTITRDKWICMFILAALTAAGFLADLLLRRLSRPRLLPCLFGAGLLLWTVLSCLFSPYPGAPWWLGTGRLEGLASRLVYLGLFFLFSCARVRRGPVLVSAGCGVFVFLAVVLLQRAGGNPFGLYPEGFSYEEAPYFLGTIGNVDMCAGYLVIACGLFLPAFAESVRGLVRPAGKQAEGGIPPVRRPAGAVPRAAFLFAALSASVILLFLMGVEAGLLALAVLLFFTFLRLLPRKFRLPVLVLLLAVLLLVVWFWPGQGGPVWELHETLRGRPQDSFGSGRVGVWSRTAGMLSGEGRLWTGTGPDTFAARFRDYVTWYNLRVPEEELIMEYYDTPHCEYLALLADCGVPALLCFLALVLAGCFGAPSWKYGVLGYAVQACLSFSVCLVAPMFWVVLGLSLAAPPGQQSGTV